MKLPFFNSRKPRIENPNQPTWSAVVPEVFLEKESKPARSVVEFPEQVRPSLRQRILFSVLRFLRTSVIFIRQHARIAIVLSLILLFIGVGIFSVKAYFADYLVVGIQPNVTNVIHVDKVALSKNAYLVILVKRDGYYYIVGISDLTKGKHEFVDIYGVDFTKPWNKRFGSRGDFYVAVYERDRPLNGDFKNIHKNIFGQPMLQKLNFK
ncbi:hypothetical protein HY024_03915 [Candidatus Curtissbacteria bacterium]|nr:hypothetical protein [Candidatus Curtissbacteria bacterium]